MDDPEELSRKGHIFRPGPFRAARAFWLDGDALLWRVGARKGAVALGDIVRLRLNLVPGTAAHSSVCEIVERSGRRHRITDRYWLRRVPGERWRPGAHERRIESFAGLVFPLVRDLARHNPGAAILTGPGRGEWLASLAVAAAGVVMILGGAGLMIAQGKVSWAALAFMGMLAAYLPLLWPVLRSGGPQPLDIDSLPGV